MFGFRSGSSFSVFRFSFSVFVVSAFSFRSSFGVECRERERESVSGLPGELFTQTEGPNVRQTVVVLLAKCSQRLASIAAD